jgi:hypothetical protein
MSRTDPALDPNPLRSPAEAAPAPAAMDVRPILSHELVVGDYLGVIASMQQPEHFRRVHVWLDVPQDRRTADENQVYWGVLSGGNAPLFTFSRLPDKTDTWQQHRIQEQQAFWQRD